MNPQELKDRLHLTEEILKKSQRISLEGYSKSPGAHPVELRTSQKSSFRDLVTEYDRRVEAFITHELRQNFPGEDILGEEGAYGTTTAVGDLSFEKDLLWVLDPIDGTSNFSRSYPYFCSTLALLQRSAGQFEVILGITLDPLRNECFSAALGQGASLNGERIRVSRVQDLRGALLVTGFATDPGRDQNRSFDRFMKLTRKSLGVRRSGAAALDLAYVAIGRLDAYWESGLSAWDLAAGSLMVKESQGKVSHFDRPEPWNVWTGEILASNGLLHDEVLSQLRAH